MCIRDSTHTHTHSHTQGYKRKNAYIAAQGDSDFYVISFIFAMISTPNEYTTSTGPMEETVEDFWRMISENELSTIVMVTRLIEGPKVNQLLFDL